MIIPSSLKSFDIFLIPYIYALLAHGQTQGSTLQQRTNKTLTTGPFGNTCEVDEVSPEVEAGVVVGLKCLHLAGTQICDHNT
jgi:hypothetical protein